jgi:hypothetical protein
MHLKEFVKDALVEIIQGIKAAQDQPGAGGYIAPEGVGDHEFPRDGGVLNSQMIVSTVVKFDVAVTAESSVDGGGGAKLRIAIVEANLGASGNSKNTQVSRIQFSVPLVMPKNPRDWSNERSSIATVRAD